MLSGTTLADVTQDKGNMSKIDDTYQGKSEPKKQAAQSKSQAKKDLNQHNQRVL
jgi:hypothetical protein